MAVVERPLLSGVRGICGERAGIGGNYVADWTEESAINAVGRGTQEMFN